jgi:hypothetical protein
LVWDLGLGFENNQISLGGWIVVVFATAATLVFSLTVIF